MDPKDPSEFDAPEHPIVFWLMRLCMTVEAGKLTMACSFWYIEFISFVFFPLVKLKPENICYTKICMTNVGVQRL